MERTFRRGLLMCCVLASTTVCGSEDAAGKRYGQTTRPDSAEYEDEIAAAENHEHHRIIIVMPKDMPPQHVNHVHTYRLAGKGIPLIHSGKVVHDHKHGGKVAHEHGHVGKSVHSHMHTGAHGHKHRHVGFLGHKHFGDGGHEHAQLRPAGGYPWHSSEEYAQPHRTTNAGDNHAQQQPGPQFRPAAFPQRGGFRPVSGQVQFVPSSQPHGLGSFVPSEIQQYVDGRQELQHRHHHHHNNQQQQQQQQHVADHGNPPSAFNVIQLQLPDEHGPNLVKHVDIDLTNNVAKLQTSGKHWPVTANYKAVTQYNKVIGHGRAKPTTPEEEFDSHADDEDIGAGEGGAEGAGGSGGGGGGGGGGGSEGGGLSVEDVGYRFGEGYRLALDTGDAREFSSAQDVKENDDDELDEFRETASDNDDDDDTLDANAYSQTYSSLSFDRVRSLPAC